MTAQPVPIELEADRAAVAAMGAEPGWRVTTEERERLRADAEATWRALDDQDARTAPLSPTEIDADPVASQLIPATLERPRVRIERVGPSYRVSVHPLRAVFLFRDVRTTGELSADVAVAYRGAHLFRTTVTLSLTGRERIGKVARDLCGEGTPEGWKLATFAAVEAVLEAEERLGMPVDLRTASLELPAGGLHAAWPFWPMGSVVLVSPGDAGKSTIARAVSVSLASGRRVIPGIEPVGDPRPVLYVAGEDPVSYWHSRSIEAICRGAGIDRSGIGQPIELFDAAGRPLHRLGRALAERAQDFGAVVLDSQQALLAPVDANGGIRDRDGLFWGAIDQLGIPALIIAHPNRSDARDWMKADGRIAGSEVNRDRARMAWRATWKDEAAVVGSSFRRYTLENVKNNHGPREAPLSFGASWLFGLDGDPGVLQFTETERLAAEVTLSPELQAALDAYRGGMTTPAPLASHLGIPVNTAKSRLRLLRERDLLEGSEDVS